MGNACCNNKSTDGKQDLDFEKKNKKQPQKMDPNLNELLAHAKANEEKIVKIQSGFRGYKARKEINNDEGGSKPSHREK